METVICNYKILFLNYISLIFSRYKCLTTIFFVTDILILYVKIFPKMLVQIVVGEGVGCFDMESESKSKKLKTMVKKRFL